MLGTVVAAFDGSDHAWRAARLAGEVARGSGQEVVILHVEAPEVRGEPRPPVLDAADDAVRFIKDSGVSARLEVRSSLPGRTAREIVIAAGEEDATMIVMGTRGRSELTSLVLGSVAHKVIHLSDLPVVVVP
jgi:nucleotide-binding universal stress UspA family protein